MALRVPGLGDRLALGTILGRDIAEKCPVAPSSSMQPRGTTHTNQHPDGGSEESGPSNPLPQAPPHPTAKAGKQQRGKPTFGLLHAAGCSGRRCHGDLFVAFRMGGRGNNKNMLEKNERSADSFQPSWALPPSPTPRPRRGPSGRKGKPAWRPGHPTCSLLETVPPPGRDRSEGKAGP